MTSGNKLINTVDNHTKSFLDKCFKNKSLCNASKDMMIKTDNIMINVEFVKNHFSICSVTVS